MVILYLSGRGRILIGMTLETWGRIAKSMMLAGARVLGVSGA